MGSLSDLLNDMGNSNTDPMKFLGDAFGTVAQFSGYLGAAVGIVNSLMGKGDQTQIKLDQILSEIKKDFHALQAEQRAQNIVTKLTNLGDQLAAPKSILADLQNLLSLQPPLPDPDRRDKIESCYTGITALAPDGNWEQVYSDQIYWTDDTIGLQAPPGTGDDLVFSYTYVLPAYMQALFMFLTVARSLDRSFPTGYEMRIRDAASLLKARHDKIINEGIKQVWQSIDWPGTPDPYPIWWRALNDTKVGGAGIEYGAVEVFSGYSAIGVYKLAPSDASVVPLDLPPINKFQIRMLRKAKQVYLSIGLRSVWDTINNLNQLVGDPPLSVPNYSDWSIREIAPILLDEAPSPHPRPPGAPISLRELAHILGDNPPSDSGPVPPYAVRRLLEPVGT
jgi:hypothetical protein